MRGRRPAAGDDCTRCVPDDHGDQVQGTLCTPDGEALPAVVTAPPAEAEPDPPEVLGVVIPADAAGHRRQHAGDGGTGLRLDPARRRPPQPGPEGHRPGALTARSTPSKELAEEAAPRGGLFRAVRRRRGPVGSLIERAFVTTVVSFARARSPERLSHPLRRVVGIPPNPNARRTHVEETPGGTGQGQAEVAGSGPGQHREGARQGRRHEDGREGHDGDRVGAHRRPRPRPRAGDRRPAPRPRHGDLRPGELGQVHARHARRGRGAAHGRHLRLRRRRARHGPDVRPGHRRRRRRAAHLASPTPASRRSRSPTCSSAPAPSTSW